MAPRRSEVKVLQIQEEFCRTMQSLRLIWDEIGISDEGIESRGATVLFHIRSILNEMVDEEQALRDRMLSETQQIYDEITHLCECLQLPCYSPDEEGVTTIRVKRNSYKTKLSELNVLKDDRMLQLSHLQNEEQHLCDQLSLTPYYIPSGSIPSQQQLDDLKDHIETLKNERKKRIDVVTTKRREIISYYDELDLTPDTTFAQDLINDEVETCSLSGVKLKEVEQLRTELSHKKEELTSLTTTLWGKITTLWDRLDVERDEREQLKTECYEIKPHHVEQLKKTLGELERLKLANLQRLTEGLRCEIVGYYEKCYYSSDERAQFTPAYDEMYTEELLEEHEQELERIKTYYNVNKEMFNNVEKWNKLFVKLLEMESKSQDSNRYNNRGGGLLKEEKERKKIIRQLPKIEEELFADIETWEEANGRPFLVEGTRFSDYVHSQWEVHELKKKNEKLQRQEKKQQELQMEMTFGSTPKTPTKRRFLQTTIKTPTLNQTKKMRNESTMMLRTPNQSTSTWRTPASGLQHTPRSIGRPSTAASTISSSRTLRSGSKKLTKTGMKTPQKKTPQKTPQKRRSPLSMMNDEFSTTVVQQNQQKVSKVHDSTPYSRFAKEITSNAESRGSKVRSSAIGDYSKF